jgi:hypothetical protein
MRRQLRTPTAAVLAAIALVAVMVVAGLVDTVRAQTTTALTGTINFKVNLTQDASVSFGLSRFVLDKAFDNTFTTGSGANQIDRLYAKQRTITASANEDLDLAGALTDNFGQTLTLARIKGYCFKAASTNTNSVNVTRPATNGVPIFLAAGDGFSLTPGESTCRVIPSATGVAVTAGTGDLINVANSGAGTSVTYDVVIIGSST